MDKFTLIIGNKNYSSWSLRSWLAMSETGIAFDEIVIPLYQPGAKEEILSHSPAGKVPILRHGDNVIWESLAICEYLAEILPDTGLWPEDPAFRAAARAVSHEMHGGFTPLRRAMPMNCRASKPGRVIVDSADEVAGDIARITAIWRDCRNKHSGGGDFLFGGFTIADAMFAPIVSRFRTYEVAIDPVSQRYMEAVCDLPSMKTWVNDARAEPWTVHDFEI